ncbi:hypothetical protein KJ866_02205 [Patescibacteria group bacterium]|nr:hypothetical protein [Patescibacteria group bacterium]MBU2219864.1 hypothetical protein [Patescibacteria group bacterium]
MDSDIKYEFQKLTELIDRLKREDLYNLKEKFRDFNMQEIKYALKEIKDKLDNIESKIQK